LKSIRKENINHRRVNEKMPDKLFKLADREGILVGFFDLPWGILGAYRSIKGKPPVILLHKKIKHRHALLRCILAEELGHHFTTAHDLLVFARSYKYLAMKHEKLALWWATKYLIPFSELVEAVNRGLLLTHELAEHFDVTERFMEIALKLYYKKRRDAMVRLMIKVPEEIS